MRAVSGDLRLEQVVNVLDLFPEFFPPFFGVLAKQRQGALEAPGGHLLEIDALFLQPAVEIGQLGDHADGPDDRERRGDDVAGHTGHQVTPARRHLVHRDDQRQLLLTYSQQLRCGESVLVHGAAGILQPHQHPVALRGHRENRRHLLPKRRRRRGADVPLEVDDEDTLALGALLVEFLALALALLGRLLEPGLAQHRTADRIAQLLEAPVQVFDGQTALFGAPAHFRDDESDDDDDRHDHRAEFGKEQSIVEYVLKHDRYRKMFSTISSP